MSSANATPQTKVFISYTHDDSEAVERLEVDLYGLGFQVWVDRSQLVGGADWSFEIERQIQDCDVVVVALSPESVNSRWVRREIAYARQDNLNKFVIPILVQTVELIPFLLIDLQYIDFRGWLGSLLSPVSSVKWGAAAR